MIIVQKYGGTSVASLEHIKKVANFIKRKKNNNKMVVVVSAMAGVTNNLLKDAKTLSTNPNLREVDQLLSTGETISASMLAICLNEIGVASVSLTARQAGIITNNNYSRAFIKSINTKRIKRELEKNKVVVVTGFQGVTQCGETTTLGRGGSDTTAIALACALNASCEIYSDIDCLYACDPKMFSNPKPLKIIKHNVVMEMAFNGAKALETRAVEIAKKYNKTIYLGRSLNMDKDKGTIIKETKTPFEKIKIINLCTKKDILHAKIIIFNKNKQEKKLFNVFSKYSIPLEMFKKTIFKDRCCFTFCIEKSVFNNIKNEFELIGDVDIDEKSKISLVGCGLATHSEVLSEIVNLLYKNNIEIKDIAVSEIVISILIEKKDLKKTASLLIAKFELGSDNEKI